MKEKIQTFLKNEPFAVNVINIFFTSLIFLLPLLFSIDVRWFFILYLLCIASYYYFFNKPIFKNNLVLMLFSLVCILLLFKL